MAKPAHGKKPVAGNPLAVTVAFMGVVECAFAYPVTKLTGSNQTIFVIFMVCFPILVLALFFLVVWCRPTHLYGPKDYSKDEHFLSALVKTSALKTEAVAVTAVLDKHYLPEPVSVSDDVDSSKGAE